MFRLNIGLHAQATDLLHESRLIAGCIVPWHIDACCVCFCLPAPGGPIPRPNLASEAEPIVSLSLLLLVDIGLHFVQIYVEIERARLTRKLAQLKEREGNIAEAADVLQEVAVVCVHLYCSGREAWQRKTLYEHFVVLAACWQMQMHGHTSKQTVRGKIV